MLPRRRVTPALPRPTAVGGREAEEQSNCGAQGAVGVCVARADRTAQAPRLTSNSKSAGARSHGHTGAGHLRAGALSETSCEADAGGCAGCSAGWERRAQGRLAWAGRRRLEFVIHLAQSRRAKGKRRRPRLRWCAAGRCCESILAAGRDTNVARSERPVFSSLRLLLRRGHVRSQADKRARSLAQPRILSTPEFEAS